MSKKLVLQKIQADDVKTAVFNALKQLDAAKLIESGQFILLKPNVLSAKEPERAVTTHPEIIRAVIQWVKQFKPSRIVVTDSSGGVSPTKTRLALKKSGIQQICDEEEVECFPLAQSERKIYPVKNSLVLDQVTSSKLLEQADIIINLPKIKTHGLTVLTCCVKNMFGTVISGNKQKLHLRFPRIDDFTSALLDIYSVSQPQITLVDGYYCQEGRGPAAGDVVKLDLILAGYDGIALDALVCKIIGLNPNDVIYLPKAQQHKLGSINLEDFDLEGETLAEVQRDFKIPLGTQKNLPVPAFLGEYLSETVFRSTIHIDKNACRLCGTCWHECPAEALVPPTKKVSGSIPNWNKDQCISCYCCAELCPYEAIDFQLNPMKNALFSGIGITFLLILLSLTVIAGYFIL